jgi:hypothetical protein
MKRKITNVWLGCITCCNRNLLASAKHAPKTAGNISGATTRLNSMTAAASL